MCLNEICNEVCVDKHLSDIFPIQNCLKQGDALSSGWTEIKQDTSASGLCKSIR
jgi:hypothetical protein